MGSYATVRDVHSDMCGSWDVDCVKVDWCGGHLTDPKQQHTAFSEVPPPPIQPL